MLRLSFANASILALLLIGTGRLAAQGPVEGPVRVPPRLTEFVAAEHPPGLEDRSEEVLLDIIIETDGSVSDVSVAQGPGEGFDERAVEAARAFRFEPATRDGEAVRARIRYRYVFEVQEVVTVEQATEEPEAGETDPDADPTDPDPDTSAEASEGEESSEGEEEEDEEPELVFGAVARAEPPPRDLVRRSLPREVLTRIPGTRGDALRAVELLPGVGRPAFGGGVLIVRGAAPGDSQVFLDGNPVPLLYHFGGLTSFWNSDLLQRIDFAPGNFSVRYGRKIGGILEVEPRDPRTDGYHGYIDIEAIDAQILFEGPIGDHFSFALAFRRSYIDAFFDAIVSGSDGFAALTAPVYYDYQAIATWTPTPDDRLRLYIYGSSDELRFLLNDPSDTDPAVRGNLGVSTQFHRGQLSWRHLHEGWFEQEISLGFGANLTSFNLGDSLSLQGNFFPVNGRAEWRMQLAPTVRVIAGLDMQITPLTLSFRGPSAGQSEGATPEPQLSQEPVEFATGDVVAYRPAAYVESDVTMLDWWDVGIGVRADWYREIEAWTIDPRLTTRFRITETNTAIRAGVGLFSQPPEFQESAEGLGNPALDPLHSVHVGLGVDQRIPEFNLSFSLDGFYKHIWDRPISTAGGRPPFFVNEGLGRIYGMEVAARIEPGGPLPVFGFLSYTLSRSERQDGPDAAWRLFDFDQTHIFTLALVWNIGLGFEAGATFRLVSGNPFTPVTGSLFDVRTGLYRPVYAPVNSDRNPLFHRLDVRVSKLWIIGDVRLLLYIDVQNVYNQTNREGVLYNYDYSQTQDLPGLPIIPSIGLRGEL